VSGTLEHVPLSKLAISVDGSRALVPADATNGLDVDVTRVSGTVTVDGSGVTQPVSGTVTANLAAGTNNIGDVDVLTLPALPAGTNNIGDVDIASIAAGDNNIGNVDVVTLPALPAGTNNIGDVDVLTLPALPAGNNNIGDVDVASIAAGTNLIGQVNVAPQTTGGLSIFRTLDADETEEDVKTSAGQLYGYYIYNDGAAEVYVKFYNATAANVTVGSTTPVLTIPIPAGSAANVEWTNGIAFGTAITIAATTGVADADTAAPAANQVVANVFYK
jgi:hypothetical protein